jgi:transposase-like protein
LRNALAKTPKRLQDAFKLLASKVMYADSEQGAQQAFRDLKIQMANDAERAVKCLEKDLDSLLAHYKFEKKFWRVLRTTNPIERVNKELKRRTKIYGNCW